MVKYSSASSHMIDVTSGVPQGSLLGPFLFNLFINDIAELLDIKFLLFADDIKIFNQISSTIDCFSLQRNLDNILHWCRVNAMDLNEKKCVAMQFTRSPHVNHYNYYIGQHALKSVKEVRDLGVYLTSNLHPNLHISRICSKAYTVLGFIFRTTRGPFSLTTIKILYMTLVRSILEYNSPVWSPYQLGLVSELERVQNRFLRYVGVKMGFPYSEVQIDDIRHFLDLLPLSERRTMMDSVLLFKICNGLMDCPELLGKLDFHVPRHSRHQQLFTRSYHSTAYQQHSLIPRLIRTGNYICGEVDFFGCSLSIFRSKLEALLGRNMNHQ